ncbi:hypothetical protein [Bacteroides sp. 51]|uniref:hypothetical protein n=1 Tax=Bacteroides sp. 51 TaxID=2302938 RepID=UPI0013D58908|nr:hypothetical protein [Bacteroides sp. 51]
MENEKDNVYKVLYYDLLNQKDNLIIQISSLRNELRWTKITLDKARLEYSIITGEDCSSWPKLTWEEKRSIYNNINPFINDEEVNIVTMDKKNAGKPLTPAQLKMIQTLFSKQGFEKEDKADIISKLTNGRAASTKDVTFSEAKYLIAYLKGEIKPQKDYPEKRQRIYDQIYALSRDIGICYGETEEDDLMNAAKLNRFCRERGTVKKDLTEMSLFELRKTLNQFEAINHKGLDNAVNSLINKSLKSNEKATK